MTRAVLALLALLIATDARAQSGVTEHDLQADFRYLVSAVEETHPDPYSAFGGRVAFHRAARDYLERISEGTTLADFRALANEFMAVLEDGHTGLGGSGGNDGGPRRPMPLSFRIAHDGLFVDRAAPEQELLIGARVLEIESRSTDALLEVVPRLTPSENRYGAYSGLRRLLRTDVSARRLLPGVTDHLSLTLLTPAGDTVSASVPFVDAVELPARKSALELGRSRDLLHWRMIGRDQSVAYFSWRSIMSREVAEANLKRGNTAAVESNLNWMYRFLPDRLRSGDAEADLQGVPSLFEEFRAMLEAMREQGSEYLIIDLRGNDGGMTPVLRPLFYMLYGDRFLATEFGAEYNTRISPLYLAKLGLSSVEEYNERRGLDLELGDYRFSRFWSTDLSASAEERRSVDAITYFSRVGEEHVADLGGTPVYTPRIVVLTSPSTFSAAYHLMYFLWQMGGTTVVGVPPRQAGNTFMEATPFTLPKMGLRGSISNAVQIFFPDDPERGEVFVPDFSMTWADFAAYDFDPNAEVLYALDLIAEGKVASP